MTISTNIEKYIENSKINNRLCKWEKPCINIYVMPISANVNSKEFYYSEIKRGIKKWNCVLRNNGINRSFQIINTATDADIVIHWTKVGRVFEGMCKYLSVVNGVFKKISIDVGLANEFSGKNTTDESIFFVIMHEFGHALGLGHGIDVDDVMYVPHQKNISAPSENDIYVLKEIYK